MNSMQLYPKHMVILSCSSLLLHVEAAQTKRHTRFPDVWSSLKRTIALPFCSIRMTRCMKI